MKQLTFTALSLSLILSFAGTVGCAHTEKSGNPASASTDSPHYQIETKELPYSYKGKKMIGYLARPKVEGKRPGILVVHEWWGQTEYPRHRAEMLAEQGYVALAVDMYGDRQIADHPKSAQAFAGKTLKNMKDTEGRFREALKTLRDLPEVDATKIAALGYCYGGGLVLEMMRRGVDLDMGFSYHGALGEVTQPVKAGDIKGQIYVFTGEADPMVPKKSVQAFQKQMDEAGVDYELYSYKGAVHAFTNPEATALGKKFKLPIAYDQKADQDSWQKTLSALRHL
jgi:dienelactone hydrolase